MRQSRSRILYRRNQICCSSVILVGLRRTGYGRMLFAIGDNPVAARLSGARAWQIILVLYVLSALMAAVADYPARHASTLVAIEAAAEAARKALDRTSTADAA